MTQSTATKTYTKTELISHFFSNAYSLDDAFIMLPGVENQYQLMCDQTENDLEKMIRLGKITNYITFDHILSIVSELDNFLSPDQLKRVADEIETF